MTGLNENRFLSHLFRIPIFKEQNGMAELQQESQKELTAAEVVAGEKAFIAQTYKRPPVVLSHGQGMAVWDSEGHEYLDFMGGDALKALGSKDAGLVSIFSLHTPQA